MRRRGSPDLRCLCGAMGNTAAFLVEIKTGDGRLIAAFRLCGDCADRFRLMAGEQIARLKAN